jgi:glyceraldehyde-3-phosphate dehydrogenase (NADP+)
MKTAPPQLLIGGQWVDAPGRLPVLDPFTGGEIAQAPLGDATMVDAAIAAAHRAFPYVRDVPAHERAALLERIASGIEARQAEFVETIVAEAGKPVTFSEAEVARAILTFRVAAHEARNAHGEILPLDALPTGAGHFGMVQRFPIGVVSAITPFNFPLNLVAHKVAPCIATGNTMVVKPATRTPLTALLLARVLVDSGLRPGQVNFVTCSNDDAVLLATDERIRKMTFTGSPAVGWRLKALCGKKRITLELGGNAGCIVHADANLEAAVPSIALGAFGQAGQSCISVQRIAVCDSIYETFRERFVAHVAEKIRAGDPRRRDTVAGPMITPEALAGIRARIDEAVVAGARILYGGGVQGQCLEPTILENAPPDCALCAEEAFAPVATLHRYATFEAALALVNESKFGLQAGVFTRDLQLALRAFRTLEVGGVLINQVPTFRVESMPYGGVKDSGFGREGLRYAMEEMTELRSLIIRMT